MKVVFFGTPSFALPTLQALLDRPEFDVVAVVSQPDRPKGRGKKLQPTPVKALAESAGVPVWQPERIKKSEEALQALEALEADAFVVVAYGQILSQRILDMPRLGCINVHGSLLPAYRGAAPIQWAIANGDAETGITTMQMDIGMDTGNMLLKRSVEISPNGTSAELAEILAPLGAELLVETLLKLDEGAIQAEPQAEELATYASLLSKADFELDWSQSALELHNRIRAFSPNCFTEFSGQRCKIIGSQSPLLETSVPGVSDGAATEQASAASPGTVIDILKGKGFFVQTGDGCLRLTQVQLAGKKAQSAWDFANGMRLEVGQTFGSDR
ncbi:MAG: methionyl-tRNA formyltransferase [Cyanobacteria bacterium J06597_1]